MTGSWDFSQGYAWGSGTGFIYYLVLPEKITPPATGEALINWDGNDARALQDSNATEEEDYNSGEDWDSDFKKKYVTHL